MEFKIHTLVHASLIVADAEKSLAFYCGLLALEVDDNRPDLGYPGAWLNIGEQQIHLLQHLLQTQSRVSYEHLLSGQGLVRLYQYFNQSASEPAEAFTTDFSDDSDAAANIAQRAAKLQDPHAIAALSLFMSIYGARAGDLALSYKATGGLFITGGIAQKNLAAIKAGEFMQSFVNKPPMTQLLQTIPVKVIINPDVGMLGALEYCLRNGT